MEVQQIDVFIDKNGEVRIEVRGAKGKACLDITAAVEQALGGKVQAREMTAEALEGPAVSAEEHTAQHHRIG